MKPSSINLCIAFLLINFTSIFLSHSYIDKNIVFYIIWINTNLIYLASVNNIFNPYYNSGILEQIIIQNINIYTFFFKKIIKFWFKTGFIISTLSTLSIFLLIFKTNLLFFFSSLIYSTLMLSFIAALINSVIISQFNNIIGFIISLPIVLPILIIGQSINNLTKINYNSTILIGILSLVTITVVPAFIVWIFKMTVEEN